MIKICPNCKKEFTRKQLSILTVITYCSKACWKKFIKGKCNSPQTQFKKGEKALNPFPKGVAPWNKGKKWDEEVKKKMSESHKRNPNFYWLGKKRNVWWLHVNRKPTSLETRKKLSEALRGEKSYLWRGGITKENKRSYKSLEYKLWREAVFKRDNWTCQVCGAVGVYLEADHIKAWAYYPELRYEVSNGRTLCKKCHSLTSNYKNKGKIYFKKYVIGAL